jgi:outer membrane protein TolC
MKKTVILITVVLGLCHLCCPSYILAQRQRLYLSLRDISTLALWNNLDIQIARYDAYIKRNNLKEATSIFDTILNANFSYKDDQTKQATSITGSRYRKIDYELGLQKKVPSGTVLNLDLQQQRDWSDSVFATTNPSYNSSINIGFTQPIGKNFLGMIDRSKIRITRLDIANSDYTSLDKIELSLAGIQKVYWRLVFLNEELHLKNEMLKEAQRLSEIYMKKYKTGLAEAPDLFAAQANVERRKNDILQTKDMLQAAESDLLFRLNEEKPGIEIVPQDSLEFEDQDISFTDSLKIAIEKRRDYRRLKNELKAKKINLALKENNLWPEIDLEASFLRNGLSSKYKKAWQGLSSEDNPQFYFGVKFEVSLENSQAQAQYHKANLQKAKSICLLKQCERRICTQINTRVTTVNILKEKIIANEKIWQLEGDKLKAEEVRLRLGRSNSDTVINYQQDLLEAQIAYIKSLFDYKIALIDLKLAMNTLLDEFWRDDL